MKPISRAQAGTAGLAVIALLSGIVGVTGIASASTEPAPSAPIPAPSSLSPDDCLDRTVTPARDTDAGCRLPVPARKTVKLDWQPVVGATGYRVQVGTDNTWSDDPTFEQDVVSSEVTLPVSLPHASYVWRVAALRGKETGHWSSESNQLQPDAQFTRGWRDVAQPTTPTQGSTVTGARTTFAWSPVAGASSYELQVSSRNDFGRSAAGAPDTTSDPTSQTQTAGQTNYCYTARTRITPFTEDAHHAEDAPGACIFAPFQPGTPLFWRVRALDRFVTGAADNDTTPASTVGISHLPPVKGPDDTDIVKECPASKSITPSPAPSASAAATPAPTASATPAPTATPLAVSPVGGDAHSGPDCAPTHPSELGSWSAISSFTEQPAPPVAGSCATGLVCTTSLAQEPDGACKVTSAAAPEKALCRDFPTLSWGAVAGATRYRVNIGLDDQFSNIQRIVETSALSWTPTDSWRDSSPGTSYYYAVQACTDSGCGAVTSTPPSFRKASDRTTLGARPAVAGDFTLSWRSYADSLQASIGKATQDAYAYHLQVATADHASYDVLTDEVTVDQTSYVSPKRIYPDGNYVWRVQALDSAGHRLPWSLSQAFTRDVTPPTAVVYPNTRVAVMSALLVVFSEPVTGVSSSSLTLGVGAPSTVSVLDRRRAVIVPTRPLMPGARYTVTLSPAIKDLSGNSARPDGPTLTVNPFVDDSSRAVSYAGPWRTSASSDAVGGSDHAVGPTGASSASASLAFAGTGVAVTACLGPANGYLDVYLDGSRLGRVSTYRSYSGCGARVAAISRLPRARHLVRLVAVGAHAGASTGNQIGLDALTVTP